MVNHFAVAKQMGITDEELDETIQLAYSVGAGVMWATATRARKASEDRFRWWEKGSVQRAVRGDEGE